ncbi:hypothetical protein [Alteromonas sp. KUL49]|uniref:hypothetical protein n=1 Tax=Alteromonas sp. KUL49 TaxID=2480798 RepID=UPI0013EE4CBF|nr:hypothetical protein [Alteromonas sp. KUL49]
MFTPSEPQTINEACSLVIPKEQRVKQYEARLDESFRQRLFVIYTASTLTYVDGYTA